MTYECTEEECGREFDSKRGRSLHIVQTHENDRPWTDPDRLRQMYHEQKMNQAEIADEFGTIPSVISEWMQRHEIEARDNSESKLNELGEQPWHDEEKLRTLYHDQGMSLREIGDEFGCVNTIVARWMDKFGIERRDNIEAIRLGPAPFSTIPNGHEVWKGPGSISLGVHRIVAIADGADPHVVFDGNHHVHHKNGIPWDNRPENLEVLTVSEHRSLHAKQMSENPKTNF